MMSILVMVVVFSGIISLLARIGFTTEKDETDINSPRRYYKEREPEEPPLIDELPEMTSKDLILRVLIRMGCQPYLRQDDNIIADIMGRTFVFTFYSNEFWIRISEPYWFRCGDPGDLKCVVDQAMNLSNRNFGPKIVSEDKQDATLYSSVYDCIFHPALTMDELEDYLKHIINSFFSLEEHFRGDFRYLSGIKSDIGNCSDLQERV